MPLSWNEIRSRALAFSREWADAASENAQAKPFWIDFFDVFGISSKRVASFEEPVKKLGDKQGFIDLFWKGVLLVEHKSRGKDLDKAYGRKSFASEAERVAFLFQRYQTLTSLLPKASAKVRGRKKLA